MLPTSAHSSSAQLWTVLGRGKKRGVKGSSEQGGSIQTDAAPRVAAMHVAQAGGSAPPATGPICTASPPAAHKTQRVQGWAAGPLPLFAGSVQAGVFFGSSREGCSILSSILITDPRGLLGMFLSTTFPLSRHCCRDVGETTASQGAGTAWGRWGEHVPAVQDQAEGARHRCHPLSLCKPARGRGRGSTAGMNTALGPRQRSFRRATPCPRHAPCVALSQKH